MSIIFSLTSHLNGKHICIQINAENKQCVTNATFRAFSFTHPKDDKDARYRNNTSRTCMDDPVNKESIK